jgi:hypothetical protein
MSNNNKRKGIKTYGPRGILFRSLAEARWAYIFDILNFEWKYEPFELNGYIPDFIINTHTGFNELLIEIKGGESSINNLDKYLDKIIKSGWEKYILILPSQPQTDGLAGIFYDINDNNIKKFYLNIPNTNAINSFNQFIPFVLPVKNIDENIKNIELKNNLYLTMLSVISNHTAWKSKTNYTDFIKLLQFNFGTLILPYIKLTFRIENYIDERIYIYYNNNTKIGLVCDSINMKQEFGFNCFKNGNNFSLFANYGDLNNIIETNYIKNEKFNIISYDFDVFTPDFSISVITNTCVKLVSTSTFNIGEKEAKYKIMNKSYEVNNYKDIQKYLIKYILGKIDLENNLAFLKDNDLNSTEEKLFC